MPSFNYASMKNCRNFSLLLIIGFAALTSCKTLSWTTLSDEQNLKVSYSWEKLKKKSESGAEMRIHVWVQNNGTKPLEYDLGLEFFVNGKQVEAAPVAGYCAKPGINYKGKMSGVYFEPVSITQSQIDEGIVSVELVPLNISEVERCE